MLFDRIVESILLEKGKVASQRGMDTDWRNEKGDKKITLQQVIKWLDDNNIKTEEINMSLIKPIIINADYENRKKRVKGVNLKHPIIVVKKNGKFKSIIDGNHRAFKAMTTDQKKIKTRVIDLDSKDTPRIYKDLFGYDIEAL